MTTAGKTNLADVARLAGVSVTSASRFFNAPAKLRPETRDRIADAVSTLDFVPSMTARALALARSNTIGAIVPTFDHALFAREMTAMADHLSDHGYALILSSGNYEPAQEFDLVRTMIGRNVDGLFLVGLDRDPAIYDLLDRKGIPYVTAWTIDRDTSRPQVGADSRAAARDIADHLLDLGHERLAVVDLPSRRNDRARSRLAGFRDALAARGRAFDPARVIEAPADHQAGATALRELMAQPSPPSAILCGSDVVAIGILLMAPRLGIRVPRDLSVTGFDNQAPGGMLAPPLTTIDLSVTETGRGAAGFLLDAIAGRARTPIRVAKHRLVLRQSTSRPG